MFDGYHIGIQGNSPTFAPQNQYLLHRNHLKDMKLDMTCSLCLLGGFCFLQGMDTMARNETPEIDEETYIFDDKCQSDRVPQYSDVV